MIEYTNKGLLAIVGVCSILAATNSGVSSPQTVIDYQPQLNTVSYLTGDTRFEYVTGPDTEIELVLTGTGRHIGSGKRGSEYTTYFLSDESTSEFVEKYGRYAPCPVDFLNAHLQPKVLYAANQEIKSRLDEIPRGSTKDSRKWHRMKIFGRCLLRLEKAQNGEDPIIVTGHNFNNCGEFLIEHFEVGERGEIF